MAEGAEASSIMVRNEKGLMLLALEMSSWGSGLGAFKNFRQSSWDLDLRVGLWVRGAFLGL